MGQKWKAGVTGAAVALGSLALAAPAGAAAGGGFQGTITYDATIDGPGTVTLTGAISGSGTDVTTSERGVGPDGKVSLDRDDLVLGDGTIHVWDVGVSNGGSFDPATCTFSISEKGTFRLTGGDGAYAGIKGHGKFAVSGSIEFASDGSGGCDMNSAPTGGTITVTIIGVAKR